jgi:hypothetical protein
MTLIWCCPDCRMPIRLHLNTSSTQAPDGTWTVHVDAAQHVRAHLRSHG